MSTVYSKVKSARLSARKQKLSGTVSILTTLVGELETKSKKLGEEITDEMVISTCKKFIASNEEVIKVASDDAAELLRLENETLSDFLPKQLTTLQIREIILDAGLGTVGEIMGYLKANYNGQYDGRVASSFAKEYADSVS